MTKQERSALIRLAAQMVRGTNMPDLDEWPWSGSESKRLQRAAVRAVRQAEEQCRDWGVALRQIADGKLPVVK